MLRVVFDSNIFVSALSFGGMPEEAYRLAILGKLKLVVSPEILLETSKVLKVKFGWNDRRLGDAVKQIAKISDIVRPKIKIKEIEHDPDNRILEAAVTGEVDVIVSGDRHLLRLKEYDGIRIVRAAWLVKLTQTGSLS